MRNYYDDKIWLDFVKDNELILNAIKADAPYCLSVLIKDCASVFLLHKNNAGKTALHLAVDLHKPQAAKAILDLQGNLQALSETDLEGNTPLHSIVKSQSPDLFEVVKDYLNPDIINKVNSQHQTSVHVAARQGADKVLQTLLEKGGNATLKTNNHCTALHFAAVRGSSSCIRILLDFVDSKNKKNYLDSQNSNKYTALMHAAEKGYSDSCRALKGTDPNIAEYRGLTALHLASKRGYLSVVTYLIEHQKVNISQPDVDGLTPLHHSIFANKEDCFDYLLSRASKKLTPPLVQGLLKLAIQKNSYRCLKSMLEREKFADCINAKLEDNDTLLHISAKNGSYKATHLLLSRGADKFTANDNNEYPLHLMADQCPVESSRAEEERLEVCKIILSESHSLVDKPEKNGNTPLMLAAKSGNVEMVKSLLHKGSSLQMRNATQSTAIRIAVEYGNDNCLQKMFRFMTTAEMHNLYKDDPTLLHLAAIKGYYHCCRTLINVSNISELQYTYTIYQS